MKQSALSTWLFLALLLSQDNKNNRYYRAGNEPPQLDRPLSDKEKLERHRFFGSDQTKHDYVINGVVIRASNKKTAKKIYQRQIANKSLNP